MDDGRRKCAKTARLTCCNRSISYVSRGGRVVLPPNFADLKVGQRLYFSLRGIGVDLSLRPRGLHKGRLLSTRVRRAIRTLARCGPRAKNPTVCS